jgi:hypothetical protein
MERALLGRVFRSRFARAFGVFCVACFVALPLFAQGTNINWDVNTESESQVIYATQQGQAKLNRGSMKNIKAKIPDGGYWCGEVNNANPGTDIFIPLKPNDWHNFVQKAQNNEVLGGQVTYTDRCNVTNCSAGTPASWTAPDNFCSMTLAAHMTNGQSQTVINTADGYTGQVDITCTNGAFVYANPVCTVAGCAQYTGAFDFTDVSNATAGQLYSVSQALSGFTGTPTATVYGGGAEVRKNSGGAWGTSVSVASGDTLNLRMTASASINTAKATLVTVGDIAYADWVVTTNSTPPDTTPDAFSFTDATNANLSTVTTSNSITVSGIVAPAAVTATNGATFSINGGAYGTSGNINNGETLTVRLTSSGSFSTAVNTTVTVGGVSDTWSVTTLAADTTPDAFSFTDVTGANTSTVTTSNAITISGINSPAAVTATNGATFSINGGAYGTSGNISNGQTLAVRLTSSASGSTAVSTTVTVGGVSDTWSVTTAAYTACGSNGQGRMLNGVCWFIGALNQSCTTVCNAATMTYSTNTALIGAANNTNCTNILDLFGVGSGTAASGSNNNRGCTITSGSRVRNTTSNNSTANAAVQRACACATTCVYSGVSYVTGQTFSTGACGGGSCGGSNETAPGKRCEANGTLSDYTIDCGPAGCGDNDEATDDLIWSDTGKKRLQSVMDRSLRNGKLY